MSSFNDAYARKPESQLRGYVSSWIDSGPNQLSLLSRFVSGLEGIDRTESSDGFRSRCRLRFAEKRFWCPTGGLVTRASRRRSSFRATLRCAWTTRP